MKEIDRGLSIDLSRIEVLERDGNSCIAIISGKSYPWDISYETALTLIEINNRSSLARSTP